MIEVGPPARPELGQQSRVYADAFVTDPGWIAVGPDDERRRWHYVRRTCGGEVRAIRRLGGAALVTRDDGRVSGSITWFPPTGRPEALLAMAVQAGGPVLAGPAVLIRSLQADARMKSVHCHEPHLFVSLLAVDPQRQRGGRGRALLNAAIAEARRLEVPTFLTTANPANLPYYRSFGFEVTGEVELPRGAPLWALLKP